jgi:tripartite ATP-independent transporter DctM subunit
MPANEIFLIAMCITVLVALLAGFPVAFTLAGISLFFAAAGSAAGALDWALLGALPQRVFVLMTTEVLVAAPLFIFMGVMLQRSRVAEELLESIGVLFGSVRGGLAIGVVLVGAMLAASTGVVGATVVTMGLLSLPVLLRHGYSPGLACGTICAAGTLGQIIPPSIVLIFLGEFLSYANQVAQFNLGTFTGRSVSVVDLFAGALLPGLLLVVLYMAYIFIVGLLRPDIAPASNQLGLATGENDRDRRSALAAVLPPILLIVAVLGSILGGIATPTEAAAVGAAGAVFLGEYRLSGGLWRARHTILMLIVAALILVTQLFDLARAPRGGDFSVSMALTAVTAALAVGLIGYLLYALWRTYFKGVLVDAMLATAETTSMVFTILIGATMFTLTFRAFGGDEIVQSWLTALPGGLWGALAVVMLIMFLLGFFLDVLEIMFVVIPVSAPTLLAMGADPLWLGILMAVNLQTSFLTPPFGFALFYLRGVAPKSVRTIDIYLGAAPFVVIQVIMLLILMAFPGISTWLPSVLF